MPSGSGTIYPSIFNDVIGPVMRGPSSSHCAAALRIGRICRDLMQGEIRTVQVQFDPSGSLATTHATHGSDMGLSGGLLGWDAADPRLPESETHLASSGIEMNIKISPMAAIHPNTYLITLGGKERRTVQALSTGGGMIEITGIDGVPLSLKGDYYETLLFLSGPGWDSPPAIKEAAENIIVKTGKDTTIIQIQARQPLPQALQEQLDQREDVRTVRDIRPVLPVLSRRDLRVPFISCSEMMQEGRYEGKPLWQAALDYESERSGFAPSEIIERMQTIVTIMRDGIREGLAGTDYGDRILPCQSGDFRRAWRQGSLLPGDLQNRAVLYVSALMEIKSSQGLIVAAPTAGSCGALPGAVFAAVDEMKLGEEETVKGLLAAGLVGIFIAAASTFAAEICGCQAECGAASGMAAAALAGLTGGNARISLRAASLALQNIFGLTCDPVANRVEVPCLGKNVLAAVNALACANMALAGYNPVIPLDEVIAAMHQAGSSLPSELRCTGLGGLSVTPTSRKIAEKLDKKRSG